MFNDDEAELYARTPRSIMDPILEQVETVRELRTLWNLGQVPFERVFQEIMKLPVENNERHRQLATLALNLSRPLAYKHRCAAAEAFPDDDPKKEQRLQWLEKNQEVLDKPHLSPSQLDWKGYVRP